MTNQEKNYSWKLKSEGEERELKKESFWVLRRESAIGEDLRVNGGGCSGSKCGLVMMVQEMWWT